MSKPLGSSAFTDNRRAKTARKYRTQCKTCLHAIYSDQPAVWSTNPIGLVHERCES